MLNPAPEEGPPAERWLPRLPTPLAIFTFVLAGVLLGISVTKGFRDPDFFWHLTTGQLIAETGRVPTVDPFSFTWAGMPWTLHEWLAELLIYWLVSGAGQLGALVVFGLVPAAIVGVMAAMLARQGVRVLAFGLPAVLVGLVVTPYVTLRPQAISWLLLAVLLWVLVELRPDRPARVLWLVPLFILWANLHGVYVIGLGVVASYALFTLLGRTPMSPAWRWVVVAGVGCLLASMLTPAGPVGILYPLRYVDGGDWGLANIQEWQSPDFHEPAHLALLGLIVAVGLNAGRNTPGWLVMLSWVGIAMSLIALRNAPIAAVFCLPTLALGLEARLRQRPRKPIRTRRASVAVGRRLIEMAAAATIVVGSLIVLLPPVLGSQIEESVNARFPAASVDLLLEVDPDARVLADYGWGGYVINRMYETGGRVFVDGRNDMYDQDILDDYDSVKNADPGWEEITDQYRVDALLLSPLTTVTRGPAESAGWCERYRDENQVLYLRSCQDG
jgi:hypothetical protein